MRRSTSLNSAVAVATLAFGCGSPRGPATHPSPEPVVVEQSIDALWAAAIDVATERHLPLRTIDRGSGYLTTDRVAIPEPEPQRWWDCGGWVPSSKRVPHWNEWEEDSSTARHERLTPAASILVALVPRGRNASRTQIRVTVTDLWYDAGRHLYPCTSRGGFEQDLTQAIIQRADELRQLPTGRQ